MAQEAGLLGAAAQIVTSSSTKQRVAVFEASIPAALDAPGVNVTEIVPELINLIFQTVPLYEDRTSNVAVEHAISKALKEAAFVKAFAGTLVQTAERSHKVSSDSVRYKLLRWSCLLIRQNPALLSAKTAFTRLVVVQASLLTLLLQGSYSIRRASRHVTLHLLSEVPDLFEHYIRELQGPVLNSENASGIINIMLQFWTKDPGLVKKYKHIFLESYLKLVLNSREKPSKALSEAFGPLLKQLTHDDFGNTVVPTAVKMLKRNPELIMESVSLLLRLTSLDLSKYGFEFLPIILPQARHNDEGRRKEALEAVENIAVQSSDLDAIGAMFESIKSVLGGSLNTCSHSSLSVSTVMIARSAIAQNVSIQDNSSGG